ncbi:hypothetical protein F4X86_03775 [Candidatus Saccharibacteria bacterium]|nr:hypothetical protein [Candidatus Saccharibacteria bacterium]
MLKRICLLGLACLLIFSFAGAMTLGLSQEARAQNRYDRRSSLEDIQGLDSLKASLGATQNSLVLELSGQAGTHRLNFRLSDEWTEVEPGLRRVSDSNAFRYVTDFPSDLAYAAELDEDGEPRRKTWPGHCSMQAEVLVYDRVVGGKRYEDVDGYNQDWRKMDLSAGGFRARIHLPLPSNAITDIDWCFFLEADIELEDTSDKPLLALTGSQIIEDSCSGLQLYGRGGDDLEIAGVNWFCDQDVDSENLANTELHALTTVESPPFSNYFIFLESRPDSGDCGGRILVNKDDFIAGEITVEAQWQDWHDNCRDGQFDKDKEQKRIGSVSILNTLGQNIIADEADSDSLAPGAITTADTGTSALGGAQAADSCEFKLSGLGFGYLACSAAGAISGGLVWLEGAAKDNLRLDRGDYTQAFPDGGGQFTYKDAWANIRTFMTFAVVGTALFMVISTALDAGFFSNYTVKKYLPRLVVGTILIQFSWALGDLFIQLTNQLGDFMESILYAAVPGAKDHGLAQIFGGGNFASFFAGGVGVAAAIWAILLPVGFTAIVFLFIGWMFLVARKYMLIMLLILGPLGLALWVLPGSDRAWRFYSKTFFYLLLFYPIVVTTIAAGKIFSYLVLL